MTRNTAIKVLAASLGGIMSGQERERDVKPEPKCPDGFVCLKSVPVAVAESNPFFILDLDYFSRFEVRHNGNTITITSEEIWRALKETK